jgi:hypothetical protein
VDQGVRDEDKNKNKSYLWGRDLIFHQVSELSATPCASIERI